MTPSDLTRRILIGWGGMDVFNAAVRIAHRGGVEAEWRPKDHTIHGRIENEGGWYRKLWLRLMDDGTVEPHCSCERCQRHGMICEHVVVLAMLEMLKATRPTEEEIAKKNEHLFPPEARATREAPVDVILEVEFFEDDGKLDLFPVAKLPFENIASRQRFVVIGPRGYVQAGGRWFPIRKVFPAPFQTLYERDEIIERRNVPAFIRQTLPILRRFSEVSMDPGDDLFRFVPDKPRFRAEVVGSPASLTVKLIAVYGDMECEATKGAPPDSICRPDPEDLLLYHMRNLEAERAAVEMLRELGFEDLSLDSSAAPRARGSAPAPLQIVGSTEVLNFIGAGYPRLVREGWKVKLSERLNSYMDSLDSIVPVADIEDNPDGSFDVGYRFETLAGRKVSHAELQTALNMGNSFLRIDGRTAYFDAGAVKAMREVFSDCPSGEGRRGGHFRVPGAYAPYVRSSLDAVGAEFDDEKAPNWRETAIKRCHDEHSRFEPVDLGPLENTLRPYQKEGVYWMRFLEKSGLSGLLADEMGLGKTLQTLTWLSLRRVDPDARGKPALVICPTSLVANWDAEAAKFTPHLKRLVISGADRAEDFGRIEKADLVITSYALLQRDLEAAWLGKTFGVVVLDEAQHIKNRSTRNAKSAKAVKSVQKLVLTGTPVENSVADVWSIFDFLMPDYLGEYDHFKTTVEDPVAAGGQEGREAQERLRRKLHPFILRRLKKDVAKDLPDKITGVRYCPMSLEQSRLYAKLLGEARGKIGDAVKSKGFKAAKFEILAMLMRLRQVANDAALLKEMREKGVQGGVETSGKLDVFFELLDEAMDGGHRALVFSQFVGELSILRRELEGRGISYCYLDGSTKDRLGECRRFNTDESIPVFLISLHAGGTGLNLTGADMVVHFDPWWNPAVEAQATDRAHRIGQKRTVNVVKLITSHTVEERVLELQERKQSVIDATVGRSDEDILSHLTYDDVRSLIGL